MRKEHLIALVFGFGILAVAAGLYLMQPADEPRQVDSNDVLVETPSQPEAEIRTPEENDDFSLRNGDVTRIIIDDEAEDISDILSEKVLINDEVVDQSELNEPDH
ncbi:hypothetical protein [Endozoicomonas sp. 8E]|uniref:hypothetical protein n=1 Tax=Endozoicomonas sp. 8E TaxID=3035692 RepID=UPI0029390AFA|nr:hypothetical protein [Endozoicomonas sp. 8E]WOG26465.1 hypothetical protein P6910_18220 [Endozoicomonas sp. 8E]